MLEICTSNLLDNDDLATAFRLLDTQFFISIFAITVD